MTDDLSEEAPREVIGGERPDVVGVTAITPAIYQAERVLEIAKELHPNSVTVPGGVRGTFEDCPLRRGADGPCAYHAGAFDCSKLSSPLPPWWRGRRRSGLPLRGPLGAAPA